MNPAISNAFQLSGLCVLLCTITPALSRGQESASATDGFAGIPWKSSEDETKEAMRKRRGIRDGKMLPGRMEFFGGTFGLINAERWVLAFENGGLASALVRLEPGLLRIAELHKKVSDQLTTKYGPPSSTHRGTRILAAQWNVPLPDRPVRRVRIICRALISENRVHLFYINDGIDGNRPEEFWK